jgi:hypothetical protein
MFRAGGFFLAKERPFASVAESLFLLPGVPTHIGVSGDCHLHSSALIQHGLALEGSEMRGFGAS